MGIRPKWHIWVAALLVLNFMIVLSACQPSGNAGEPTKGSVSSFTRSTPGSEGGATGVQPTRVPLDPTYAAQIAAMRSADVPDLPFPDNPDPTQCGIPIVWGDDAKAWLTGIYAGELVQSTVFLYDSHLRFNVTAKAPHGAAVEILLYQQNPVTDYYLVRIKGAEQPNEGWVPGPFLSFDPVLPGSESQS